MGKTEVVAIFKRAKEQLKKAREKNGLGVNSFDGFDNSVNFSLSRQIS